MTMLSGLSLGTRPAGADVLTDAQTFLADINALRSSVGLGALTVDPQLTQVAQNWSQQMANAGDISHNPNLKDQVSGNWSKLGENVGMGPAIGDLFTAFVNSPHHYANLVDPSFNYIGIGVVYSNGTIYTTHDFMALRVSAPRVSTPPATTATTRHTTVQPAIAAPVPKPTTTTTTTIAALAPPPPTPTVPDQIRESLQNLLSFDPV
jgi:cell division septation protein DedD